MDESGLETKEINILEIPSRPILDFEEIAKQNPKIGDEGKFVRRMKLCLGENMIFPKAFPSIIDFTKARAQGFAIIGRETEDDLLSLPAEMHDGNQYKLYPELRKPVEKIIFEYQRMRLLYGLDLMRIEGRGWSIGFKRKMENLFSPPAGEYEKSLLEEELRQRIDTDSQPSETNIVKGGKVA